LTVEFGLEQAGLELLSEAEAFAFDIDRDRMMEQAIEDGAGDHGIAEDFSPGAETLVAGDDDRAALVAARDQLEEQVNALTVNRQIANLVDYQKLRLTEDLQPFIQTAFGERLAERGDQRGRAAEQSPHALLAGLHAERDR
jgi:hypothetical protein